jgi:hypothetical protein
MVPPGSMLVQGIVSTTKPIPLAFIVSGDEHYVFATLCQLVILRRTTAALLLPQRSATIVGDHVSPAKEGVTDGARTRTLL